MTTAMPEPAHSPVPDVPTTHPCFGCRKPTEYTHLCEMCSEEFLIELWNGGRQFGLRP